MRALFFIFSLFISVNVGAQLAPDFTVTDIDGNEISLYSDLLDQGIAVLIEFNTLEVVCSGCADTAPFFEDFYQYWGAGEGAMEMLFISPQDTNSGLMVYEQSSGLSYPKVGSEGGGDLVFDAYCSGEFGNFHSLPVYVVIAPDGTVAFNPVQDDEEVLMTINSILNEILDNAIQENSMDPLRDVISLNGQQLTYNLSTTTLVEFYNLMGQDVGSIKLPSGTDMTEISLPSGIVLAKLTSERQQIVQSFFIH